MYFNAGVCNSIILMDFIPEVTFLAFFPSRGFWFDGFHSLTYRAI